MFELICTKLLGIPFLINKGKEDNGMKKNFSFGYLRKARSKQIIMAIYNFSLC